MGVSDQHVNNMYLNAEWLQRRPSSWALNMCFASGLLDVWISRLQRVRVAGPLVSDGLVNMVKNKGCPHFSSFCILSLIIKSLYLRFIFHH